MELFCCAQAHPLNVRVPVFGWSAPPHASFRMTKNYDAFGIAITISQTGFPTTSR